MTKIISLYSDDFYKKKAEELFIEGVELVSQREYEESLKVFKEAEKFDDNDPEIKFYIGASYYILENFKSAEVYLRKAVDIDYRQEKYQRYLAINLFRQDKNEEAEKIFKEIINAEEKNLVARYYLSQIETKRK